MEEAVENREEDRALDVEAEPAPAERGAQHLVASAGPPEPVKHQAGADAPTLGPGLPERPLSSASATTFSEKRQAERMRRSRAPEASRLSTLPRLATTRWRVLPPSRRFSTICR